MTTVTHPAAILNYGNEKKKKKKERENGGKKKGKGMKMNENGD